MVQAHDAREIDGIRFLAMEYVAGQNLSELGHRLGWLPIADACEIARQTALGLQAIHELGLVHRDIKPSNLMLTRQGQIKILDLGLARILREPAPDKEATSAGQTVGTADYMAPEQIGDSHGVDIRADIYGLGCTLYKLLSGHAPFGLLSNNSPMAKMTAHLQTPVPPLRPLRPEIPEPLEAIVQKMLAKSPADRFAIPADVAVSLGPFVAGCDLPALWRRSDAIATTPAGAAQLSAATNEQCPAASIGTNPSIELAEQCVAAGIARSSPRRWKRMVAALVGLMLLGLGGLTALLWNGLATVTPVPPTLHGLSRSAENGDKSNSTVSPGPPPHQLKPASLDLQPAPAGDPLSETALVTHPPSILGVHSWSLETVGHRGPITAVAYRPDGRRLATATADAVRIWDTAAGSLLRVLIPSGGEVCSVAWSPDGKYLAVACHSRLHPGVSIWQVEAGRLLRSWRAESLVSAIAWSPDGGKLAIGTSTFDVLVWDLLTPNRPRPLYRHEGSVQSVAWSADGRFLASSDNLATLKLWKVQSSTLEANVEHSPPDGAANRQSSGAGATTAHPAPASAWRCDSSTVAWSPNGKTVAMVYSRSKGEAGFPVALWDGRSGQFVRTLATLPDSTDPLCWSPDGTSLAVGTGAADGTVVLDARTGRTIWKTGMHPHGARVQIAFAPDGKTLAVGSGSGAVDFFDARVGFPLGKLPGHGGSTAPVSLSPDGAKIASAHSDQGPAIRIWQRETGELQQEIRLPSYAEEIRWSAEGASLAVFQKNKGVSVWSVESGKLLAQSSSQDVKRLAGQFPTAKSGAVGRFAVLPGASAIRLLRIADGQLVYTILSLRGRQYAVVNSDGRWHGSPGLEKELVYVVQVDGGQETLTPEEFRGKYAGKIE